MTRLRRGLTLALIATALSVSPMPAAIAQVDPATVPQGFLVAAGFEATTLHLKVGSGATHVYATGSQIYVQHATIAPGSSTGWHTHSGAVIVVMVNGALTLYDGDDRTCTGETFGPGSGFTDQGFGHIHIARNEGTVPAEFYATYILPPGSGDAGVKTPLPDFHNPACSF